MQYPGADSGITAAPFDEMKNESGYLSPIHRGAESM